MILGTFVFSLEWLFKMGEWGSVSHNDVAVIARKEKEGKTTDFSKFYRPSVWTRLARTADLGTLLPTVWLIKKKKQNR